MLNNNKTIAIMMVFVFCLSFLAPAFMAPSVAEAACTATVGQSNNVRASISNTDLQNLGYFKVEVNVPDWTVHGVDYSQLLISYPTRLAATGSKVGIAANYTDADTQAAGSAQGDSGVRIVVSGGGDNAFGPNNIQVVGASGGAFVITLRTAGLNTAMEKGYFYVHLAKINTANYAGDVNVNLIPQAGTAFGTTPVALVVGKVNLSGSTTTTARSVTKVPSGGALIDTITVFENMSKTVTSGTLNLELVTKGYKWDTTWGGTPAVGASVGGLFSFEDTNPATPAVNDNPNFTYTALTPDNTDTVSTTIFRNADADMTAGAIAVKNLGIRVDEKVAIVGQDIEVKVSGAGVTKQTIVVARYAGRSTVGSISGRMVDSQGSPIVGASVFADPITGGSGYSTITNASGDYSLTGLASGAYFVCVSATGWISQSYSSNVSVTASNDTGNINFTLQANTANNTQVTVTVASPDVNISTTPVQIIVPPSVTNASLTTTPTINGGNAIVTLPEVNTTAATSRCNVVLSIYDGTQVTGPSTWNGTIYLPKVVDSNSVTVTTDSGYTASISAAIEIGLADTALTFSQPVRILLAGQGGKKAGWTRNGVFTPITNQMAADSAAALGANNDGYISSGNDMVIWTKHFTTFVTYTQTVISSGGGGGGGSTAAYYSPSIQTLAATLITPDSAVLNGDITSDNGYDISDYGFLWGTSSSSLTNKIEMGTDHSGTFQTALSSIKSDTKYYFQAYATNSYGTRKGTVMSFTTSSSKEDRLEKPTITTAPVFSDVDDSHWGYNAINILSSKGIVVGYPDGTFQPDAPITRAEFATMLVKALGLDTSQSIDIKQVLGNIAP